MYLIPPNLKQEPIMFLLSSPLKDWLAFRVSFSKPISVRFSKEKGIWEVL